MSARDVIAEAVGRTSTRCPVGNVVNDIIAALAAAGYVVAPREMTEAIYDAGRRAQEDGDLYDIWRATLAAAEAEAKETGDE